MTFTKRSVDNSRPGCETTTFSPGKSLSMCITGCYSPCV